MVDLTDKLIVLLIYLLILTVSALVQLTSRDKSRDAAGYLASKFLTRPDTRDSSLPAFLDWALIAATSGGGGEWEELGEGFKGGVGRDRFSVFLDKGLIRWYGERLL